MTLLATEGDDNSDIALSSIRVEGLFGDLDHTIVFKTHEGLTIIHGPNGVGKTTILRIVDCLFQQRFGQLGSFSFGRIVLDFADGSSLQVSKQTSADDEARLNIEFIGRFPDGKLESYTYESATRELDVPVHMIDDFVPHLERIGPRVWLDQSTGDHLSVDDVIDRYGEQLPVGRLRHNRRLHDEPWLDSLLARITTAYIKAQRLSTHEPRVGSAVHRNNARETPTVSVFSKEIIEKIANTLAKYAEFAQSLDSTFPTRVLQEETSASDDEIRHRYNGQADRRARYVSAGLLDTTEEFALPERGFNDGEQRVLATYFNDTDKKLDQLDEIATKIALFKEIVNAKFRRKELTVSRHSGFKVTRSAGEVLALTSLSSGEQQELVLVYELLFRYAAKTLVLVDEPELSLHITWQMAFIDDLLKVSRLTGLKFLIATHSPQIINERWDLTNTLRDE